MRRLIVFCLLCLILATATAWAAGTAVWTKLPVTGRGPVAQVITVVLTSDATGEVVSTSGDAAGTWTLHGVVGEVNMDPGDSTLAPSASWDLTLTNDFGIDILGGGGANLYDVTPETVFLLDNLGINTWRRVDSPLTINATNMGAANKATLRFTVKE